MKQLSRHAFKYPVVFCGIIGHSTIMLIKCCGKLGFISTFGR